MGIAAVRHGKVPLSNRTQKINARLAAPVPFTLDNRSIGHPLGTGRGSAQPTSFPSFALVQATLGAEARADLQATLGAQALCKSASRSRRCSRQRRLSDWRSLY